MTTTLTPHFTLEELTFSETAARWGLVNQPLPGHIANLRRLCETLLEPARELLGVPMHINSGFRSAAVNAAVRGAHTSAHVVGLAADFVPIGLDLAIAFDKLRAARALPFDQIIFECRAWIHLAAAAEGLTPRRQALTAVSLTAGAWAYNLVQNGESNV